MQRRKFLSWLGGSLSSLAVGTAAGAATTSESATNVQLRSHLSVAPTWPKLAKASSVPVGSSIRFTYGAGSRFAGQSGALYRESSAKWTAFDLICTHHGCTAVPSGAVALCPCHHSEFSLKTGAALTGPAQLPLTGAQVTLKSDGYVYWVKDL